MVLHHPKQPCAECPWRKDQPAGRFSAERYQTLFDTCRNGRGGHAEFGAPIFACHKTPEGRETACAGFLAVEGYNNLSVRVAVATGRLCPTSINPGADWPELYANYEEMAAFNGVEFE